MSARNVLALPVPSSPNLSSQFTSSLRQAIISHSGETHHPDAFASDISSLVDLRARVGAMEAHAASLDVAYRYYAQLVFATTKLPASVPISFPWAQPLVPVSFLGALASGGTGASHVDSSSESTAELAAMWKKSEEFAVIFDGTVFVGHPLIAWERANVLYSIAALTSTLGAQESRNDGASIKRAVAYFQVRPTQQ
jgi:programmed cell death 6-interacting protein